ncbi:cobyrinate a,c-diamide synthase [Solwaraspora sp. WMMA2056]|uniref:cobyrinate a,c-diamide synthase n=1 Tax=Solwaraspora sp. WMMA2056 TaxID=3015161 RepID=UPI00259B6C55|nr:cobyrinate a,c-diamide synthase [Solwaraspora sp. WMMA2056]WJK43113.1 cobyrinate a,c-diamide synthase [Solwaraspora sp. WMMA2056]
MPSVPRLVVSAPASGHGKTSVAIGLLAALRELGLSTAGAKIGPDHTDAAYLGAAAGRPGRNLDPMLVGTGRIGPLLAHGAAGADVAVLGGAMGLYDSLGTRADSASTATVATALRAPVVMVVDAAAMGQSIGALVHGFRAYDDLIWLAGVILNRVSSARHEQVLREALDDIGVPVLGALHRGELPAGIPRAAGVVPVAHHSIDTVRLIRRLGEAVDAAVDLDRVLALARSAPPLPVPAWSAADALAAEAEAAGAPPVTPPVRRPVIAVAGTPELVYGYTETVELITAAGGAVVPFDPLRDELLPEATAALVLPGGLPEAYLPELSANRALTAAVADLARAGRPVLAEGSGLLWLVRECDGRPMGEVFDAAAMTSDRMVVGYREATSRAATPVAPLGGRMIGYKQHQVVVSPRAGHTPAWTWGNGVPEGFVWRRVHASQLTLHWAGAPDIARRLVLAAADGRLAGADSRGPAGDGRVPGPDHRGGDGPVPEESPMPPMGPMPPMPPMARPTPLAEEDTDPLLVHSADDLG